MCTEVGTNGREQTEMSCIAEGTVSSESETVLLCSRGTAQNQDPTINTESRVELQVVTVVVKKRREGEPEGELHQKRPRLSSNLHLLPPPCKATSS